LYPNTVNVNPSILSFYTCAIVPRITRRATHSLASLKRANGVSGNEEFEDDGNYGSAATLDVEVLQSISKRVHYGKALRHCGDSCLSSSRSGKFVSEAKFTQNPGAFIPHILKPNRQALETLITKPEVERKLLSRLRKKAVTYGQDIAADGELAGVNGNANETCKIDVDGVIDLYESYIIPLTKEVEVSDLDTIYAFLDPKLFVRLNISSIAWTDFLKRRLTSC
jgi:chorismate mutase